MNVARAIDLEDTEGLIAADRGALLRAASMAGAQVRSRSSFRRLDRFGPPAEH